MLQVGGPGPAASAGNGGGVWLAGDLHVHTCYSHDSFCPPEDDNTGPDEFYTLGQTVERQFLIGASRGLDYLAITDHNDIRSQTDPGFGAGGVLALKGYEASLRGHAQVLGGTKLYPTGDQSAAAATAIAEAVRADGGIFQANHPTDGAGRYPANFGWKYGYEVVPDTVEVWNISRLWQPPAPSGSSNDDAVRYWEGWLDRGFHVGATGGSDNHWVSTTAVQGVGQPTTWIYAQDRTQAALLEGLREGRTFISHQPPTLGGPRIFLEADADGDGVFESMVGDTVSAGTPMRARVEGAAGSLLRIVVTGGAEAFLPVPVTGPSFEHRFTAPASATWARAEIFEPDLQEERRDACDETIGDETTYCRNMLAVLGMTSAIYLTPGAVTDQDVYARIENGRVTLGNSVVERTWLTTTFGTSSIKDFRTGLTAAPSPDFRLTLADGAELTGADFTVTDARAEVLPRGGVQVTMQLTGPAGARVVRSVSAFPGVAGFEVRTAVSMAGAITGYTLDEVTLPGAKPTVHAFRAGYDWRGSDSLDWEPTVSPFGGHHTGDHRVTTTAGPGQPLEGEAEWMSLARPDGSRAFMVLERVDYASSRMAYDGARGRAAVDLSHDAAYLGPFEADVHVGNPNQLPIRQRALRPDAFLALEPVFTGFALDADDEPWQHHAYLFRHRASQWRPEVVFNSNNVDANRISTGAKDDMDLAEVQRQAAVAKELGIETFVMDDGWQAASGDWCPDSPQCPEPRGLYPPRFPDDRFEAVRAELGDMNLGLWMSPMQFNPAAIAYERNPEWSCKPVGDALAVYNTAEPNSSSNEAGLGTWNPEAVGQDGKLIEYIEGRIRRAIDEWGVRYFKFDFMAWVDCAGAETVTMYDYRESFIRMLDRLIADHPEVTFQIDETNDYRLFPFESVARGPSWYANGGPKANEALHNLWLLNPWVPGFTLGQSALGGDRGVLSTDYLMAIALGSHMTFFNNLTTLSPEQVATAKRWIELYKAERERFAGFTYPLLDDPLPGNNWTALQPWNPDTQTGALLVFRQDSDEETKTIALRGIRGDGTYELTEAMTGEMLGEFTADELREGIEIVISTRHTARVFVIDPT